MKVMFVNRDRNAALWRLSMNAGRSTLSRGLPLHRFVDVESPAAYASPEAAVLTRLFASLVTDYLNELAYPADLAGVFAVRFCWSSTVLACLWQYGRRSNCNHADGTQGSSTT